MSGLFRSSDKGKQEPPNVFRDPFVSEEEKENIELTPLPFMESFLKRPFHVR